MDQRMRLQLVERLRTPLRILKQFPQTALEVLRTPARRRRDRLIDPGADDRKDEEDEDQANSDIECGKVQHRADRVAIRGLSHSTFPSSRP